ncbi:MAG: hypothetical protein IIC53_13910, partial [Proteobacteria bacterium]|nr:hypothetical protein [Pseudomonadota bacterium]
MQAQKRASAFGLRTLAGYAAFVVALCGVFALAEFAKPWLPWLLILLILGVVNLSLILFGGYFLWHSPIRAELRRDPRKIR